MEELRLCLGTNEQLDDIWAILEHAIQRRKEDGSTQWQDGYPNRGTILSDINSKTGYVVILNGQLVGYLCLKINDEPQYALIEGEWLTNSDFVVIHRLAVDKQFLGKGIASKIMRLVEDFAKTRFIASIKIDTNYDNFAMLHLFEKLGYCYCGKVYFRGSERKAFEKVLK